MITNLLMELNALAAEVDAFKDEVAKGEYRTQRTESKTVTEKLEAFESTFDKSEEVILGVS